ncbi:MAG: RNA polymerase factor sigma-54 [Phycisphaerales bacterium]|nr:RNA polymerase factor sigma-54 [Phycisphaerales bacterium]
MSQHLSLGLRQEQRLTPQLIQSMNILQLPLLALEAKIREEMERNPALEEEGQAIMTPDEVAPPAKDDFFPATDREAQAEQLHEAEGFSRLERITREYDFDDSDQTFGRTSRRTTGERDLKMDAMANTASRPESLNEYLLQQWAFVEIDPRYRRAGELIINHVEEDGYLRTPLAEIVEQNLPPFTTEEMEEALSWVQTLDPPGIGARNLRECLLIQLDNQNGNHEIERILVDHHLSDIEKNRYPAIAKATGRTIEEIKQAVRNLGKLTPYPGSLVVDREVPRIAPDVIVDYAEDGEGYTVRLARGNSPRLRISEVYRNMLSEHKNDKDARDFIRKNLESAGALIDAIHYRRNRLLEVAREVIQRQRDFLDTGPAGMKVLRMSDLADKLNCDPSTISRTVADKYMQTPRGIYPLRYFFTGGTESSNGEETSWDSVKARVQEIIDSEDRKCPLNDDEIAARPKAEGLTVSRRTIAKYRQQLHIPTARQRREF